MRLTAASVDFGMKTAKQETLELVEQLPDDVSMETITERLLLELRLRECMAQVERGEVFSHEEILEDVSRWRRSLGR